MDETQVTKRVLRFLGKEYVDGPALYPTREIADEERTRPDRILVVLRDDMDAEEIAVLTPDDLHVHSVESKVARQYLVAPDFSGVAQARDYFGHYRWLAVWAEADLDDDEWEELTAVCTADGVGLISVGGDEPEVLVDPDFVDGEHFVRYPRWVEMLEALASQLDLPFESGEEDDDDLDDDE